MSDTTWRFPDNGYIYERGLDNSDMEMFKHDPVSSLAREICQNSIDAPIGDKPVKVEFNLFSIPREEVPGIDVLAENIQKCYEYKKDSPKEGPALKILKESINQQEIPCLRISDFNTTGLIGVDTNKPGTPFYNLTKGSGVSDKYGSSGGSKGIGKYASFVVSTTNTVFYSTKESEHNSCGYVGISQLRSAPISDKKPGLFTMGIGYYGKDMNSPVPEELHLDKSFVRSDQEYGTDVYIIGFNDKKGWQSDIIAKVLDSFMVAIMKDKLEVNVNGIKINNKSVKAIIYDDRFMSSRTKTELKEIQAQYELLNEKDESVTVQDLNIADNNEVTVYVKKYNQQNEEKAIRHCVMVREPYMKIKNITIGGRLPYSALCIIHKNELNERLISIENPKHTDWEIKRLDDFPHEKSITRKMKKELEDKVKEYIRSVLRDSAGEETDMEGAGEFLPSQDNEGVSQGEARGSDQIKINPISAVKLSTPKTDKINENGEAYEFDNGGESEEGGPGKLPKNPSGPPQPNPYPDNDSGEEAEIGPGASSVLKRIPLSGMQYRIIVTDKTRGKYDCIFTSEYNEDCCDLAIRICGDTADKYPVNILTATIDGIECNIQEGKITGLKLVKDKTYKISYSVDNRDLFASEVILNAYRE